MGRGNCHKKGQEQGPWYDIKCTKEVVVSKEARGKDASFERGLLKSWSKYPGWEDARMPFLTSGKSTRKPLKREMCRNGLPLPRF